MVSINQPLAPERNITTPKIGRYTGEVVYIYAFDVAYEMKREPVRELLGQPVAQFVVDASKRSPRDLFFYRPTMVRLPALERIFTEACDRGQIDELGNGRFARSLFERACAARDLRVAGLGDQASPADLTTVTAADLGIAVDELTGGGRLTGGLGEP